MDSFLQQLLVYGRYPGYHARLEHILRCRHSRHLPIRIGLRPGVSVFDQSDNNIAVLTPPEQPIDFCFHGRGKYIFHRPPFPQFLTSISQL
jgi:hypothetical protein